MLMLLALIGKISSIEWYLKPPSNYIFISHLANNSTDQFLCFKIDF